MGARHVGFEPCGLGAVVQARFADCDFEQTCLGGRDADCLPAVFCDFESGATVSIGKAAVKREASFEHGRDVLRVKTTSVRVCACAIERQRIERADHFESLKPLSFLRAVDIECVAQFIDRKGLHDIADIAELHTGGACKARHVEGHCADVERLPFDHEVGKAHIERGRCGSVVHVVGIARDDDGQIRCVIIECACDLCFAT